MPEIAVFQSRDPNQAVAKAQKALRNCQIIQIQTTALQTGPQGNLYVLTVLYYSEHAMKMSCARSA